MKTFAISLLAGVLAITAYQSYQTQSQQQQQLASYQTQVSELLDDIDSRHQENLANLDKIDRMQDQLDSLNEDLASARQRIDPDYQQLAEDIRQEVESRYQQLQPAPQATPLTKANLVRSLSALDQREMSELMSLNMQFGPFLRSLDVGDERLEVIINALDTMRADQMQAQLELSAEMQEELQNQAQPGMPFSISPHFREKMTAISSPEAQREALSFSLNQQELQAFDDYQEAQASMGMNFSSLSTSIITSGAASASPLFIHSPNVVVDEQGEGVSIQLMDLNPPQ